MCFLGICGSATWLCQARAEVREYGALPVHPFIYQTTELFVPQTSKVVTISSIVKCQDHLPSFSGIPFHGIPVYNVDEHHSDSPFKGDIATI